MNINLHMVHNLNEDLILGSDFIKHIETLTNKKIDTIHLSSPDNNIILGQTRQKLTTHKTRTTDIHNIPNEIMVKILSYLIFQEICTFRETNTVMRDLTQNPQLWKQITITVKNLTQSTIFSIITLIPSSPRKLTTWTYPTAP
jgi:hypothetical protein